MGAIFILLGIILAAPEVMSLFRLLNPGWTPGSFLLTSFVPSWGVSVIAIGSGVGAIWLGIILMKVMLRKRYQAEQRLIDGYGEAEAPDG